MSILDELADLMPHVIGYEKRTGLDSHGAPLYAARIDVQGRVASRQKLILDATGQYRVSSGQVYLREAQGVQVRDRITLPSPFEPTQPVILAVRATPDDAGVVVEEIYL